MNEKRERKSVFFALSLLAHLLLITLLLSMPTNIRNNEIVDYSRRVFIDFDIPVHSGLKSSSKVKGDGDRVKQSISKELIPANFPSLKEIDKIKNEQKENESLPEKVLNTKQTEIPVKFSFNGKNRNEIFGIQNAVFSDAGNSGILSPSGNGKGGGVSGFGTGNKTNGNGISGNGQGRGNYYTSYYELCLRKIEGEKHYPDIAVVRQIEGEVNVKITLNSNGEVTDINIVKPSGWDMLDEEAIKCVRRASPFPSPPEEILSDSTLALSFLIVFELS